MDALARHRTLQLLGVPGVTMRVPPRAEVRADPPADVDYDEDLDLEEDDELDDDEDVEEPDDDEDEEPEDDDESDSGARHRMLQLLGVEVRARYNPAPGRQVISAAGSKRYKLPIGATILPGGKVLFRGKTMSRAEATEIYEAGAGDVSPVKAPAKKSAAKKAPAKAATPAKATPPAKTAPAKKAAAPAKKATAATRRSGLPPRPKAPDFEDLAIRISGRPQAEILDHIGDLTDAELVRLARQFPGGYLHRPTSLEVGDRQIGLRFPSGLSVDEKRRWLAWQVSGAARDRPWDVPDFIAARQQAARKTATAGPRTREALAARLANDASDPLVRSEIQQAGPDVARLRAAADGFEADARVARDPITRRTFENRAAYLRNAADQIEAFAAPVKAAKKAAAPAKKATPRAAKKAAKPARFEFPDSPSSARSGQAALDASVYKDDAPDVLRRAGLPEQQVLDAELELSRYQGSLFSSTNRYLYGLPQGDIGRMEAERMVRALTPVFEHSTLSADVVVYRGGKTGLARRFSEGQEFLLPPGMSTFDPDGDLTGAEWVDRAFASTSANQDVAEAFSVQPNPDAPLGQSTVMRIVAPEGTPAISLNRTLTSRDGTRSEAEIVLGRGLRYRVTRDYGVGTDGVRRLDVEVVPAPVIEAGGLDRQARIDRARAVAEALSEVDELADNQASDRVFSSRIMSRANRGGLTQAQAFELTAAAQSRDPARLAAKIDQLATEAGLQRVTGSAGEVVPFDPRTHRNIGAGDLRGRMVRIVRPGYGLPGVERQPWDAGTGPLVIHRATVEEATPEESAQALARQVRERQAGLLGADLDRARAEQVTDLQRLVDNNASPRAVITSVRARMRRLRLQPVAADGRELSGTDETPAARYVWQRPGDPLRLDQPPPDTLTPAERREFDTARQMADTALAVEAAVGRDGVTPGLAEAARGGGAVAQPDRASLVDALDAKNPTAPTLRRLAQSVGLTVPETLRSKGDITWWLAGQGSHPGLVEAINALPSREVFDASGFAARMVTADDVPGAVAQLRELRRIRDVRAVARVLGVIIPPSVTGIDAAREHIAISVIRNRNRSTVRSTNPAQRSRTLALLGIETRADVVPGKIGDNTFRNYWVFGKGRRRWNRWTQLRNHLLKYVGPERADRIAAEWFHLRYGFWPGSDLNRVRHGKPPRGKLIGPG